jgi:acyl transferase domain-containing protein
LSGMLRGTRTGVYVGASRGDYADLAGADSDDLSRMLPGNMGAIIANRVSHYFDFSGPSVVVDTACSSSLVALDQAVRALQSGDIDAAVAGGVNLLISPRPFEAFRQDGMESASGRCRTFDAGADGFVRGEGAAAVVLKRHADAVRDGDHVLALVRGSATNHDGRTNSLPVPSPVAQRDVIERAHRRAGTRPAEVGYVEAHGTGTKLGDPIEIRGLTDAYRGDSAANAVCALGSVKSNLGHLEFAAGIAGVVKAVLMLERGALPPSLHFVEPNPHIDFAASPFWIVDRLRPWPTSTQPRRAAVSSFGVGGTNAHVVLEQAPPADHPPPDASEWPQLVVLSAVDEGALASMADDLIHHLDAHPEQSIAALAHTLDTGRPLLPCRLAVVARDREQLLDRLALAAAAPAAPRGSGVFVHAVAPGDDLPALPPRLRGRIAALDARTRQLVEQVAVDDRLRAPEGASAAAAPDVVSAAPSVDLLGLVGELWTLGVRCDLAALRVPGHRRKVPVPGMRYRRQRCWWPAPTAAGRHRPAPSIAMAPAIAPAPPAPALIARRDLLGFLQQQVAQSLGKPPDTVDPRTPLVEMGVDSLAAAELMTAVRDATGLAEDTSFFFEHPTLARLADALIARGVSGLAAAPASAVPVVAPIGSPDHDRAIAIVGMAARVPGADTLEAFWDNLSHGRDAITDVPRARFDIETIFNPDRRSRRGSYGRWGGFLDDIDQFDARFFRIAEREARTMDPQHRLLLLTAWHALEDAGLARDIAGSRTGVYVGASYTHHRDRMVQGGHQVDDAHEVLDNHNAVLANRVSYFLDLHGPCLTIDTLCSSSLVGLDAAVQALRRGEIDRAIVAGVHVALSPGYYEAVSRLGALSPDGRCRAFDAAANGYVPGEGVIAVVLEPLAVAQRQRRHVHAVVRGTAVNHGGQSGGLTVPNPAAQAAVIRQALADAGVEGASISYLEAHGTGTALGDPVEMRGIVAALGDGAPRQGCGLGSLKSNIGHLEPAAGLAGVVKVALALQHRQLPPTLHLHEPQPAIVFEEGPCYLVDRLRPWRSVTSRRAGVSSFGLGGTNAHAVLEEAPPRPLPAPAAGPWLFALSAKSDAALAVLVERMRAFLATVEPVPAIADICRSATEGRAHFPRRIACVVDSVPALERQLAGVAAELARGAPCPAPAGAGAAATAACAFLAGAEIEVASSFAGAGFVRLPLYPFGLEATADAQPGVVESTGHPFAEVVEPLDGAGGFVVHLDGEGTA